MTPPRSRYMGRGRYAEGRPAGDEPVQANPDALHSASTDGPEATANLRTLAADARGALASYRSNAVFTEASLRFREFEWESGWTDANGTGRGVTDALLELCDDFDHLDAFVGSVADAFVAAEGIDFDDPSADQLYTLTAADIEAHGIGYASRSESIAEAERLVDEFEGFDEATTVEELEAWGDAVAVIQNDTAGSVALVEGMGAEGLEQLPDLELADGEVPDEVLHTVGSSLETALDTLPRDEPWEHTNPDNADLPFDQRLDPGVHLGLLDNGDILVPYSTPDTRNINRTLGRADARYIDEVIDNLDDGLVTVDDDGHWRPDEEELAELAELYPELAAVFGERPEYLHQDENYSGAMTIELGPDNVRTLADLTNTFGLAFDEGLIVSVEAHNGPIHRSGDHDIALSGTHANDGPFVYFVEPFATMLGTADRHGHMDEATRDALTTVIPDNIDMSQHELIATSIQQERANTLLLSAGDFSPETAAMLARNVMDAHRSRPPIQTGGASYDQFDDLEGFTSEAFLTSSEHLEPLASNEWAVYDALERNPEAGSRYYANPDNVQPVMTWGGDVDVYADGVMLASERLGTDMGDTRDRMQQTAASSVESALTSSDDEYRPQAMEATIHVVANLERQGGPVNDTISNPYMRPALANGTAANMDVMDSMINGTVRGERPNADWVDSAAFLSDVMRDADARHTLRIGLQVYSQDLITNATHGDTVLAAGVLQTTFDEAEINMYQAVGREALEPPRGEITLSSGLDYFVSHFTPLSAVNDARALINDPTIGQLAAAVLGDDFDSLGEADQNSRIVLARSEVETYGYIAQALYPTSEDLQQSAEGQSFVDDNNHLVPIDEMSAEQFNDFGLWVLSDEVAGRPGTDAPLRDRESPINTIEIDAGRARASTDGELRFPRERGEN